MQRRYLNLFTEMSRVIGITGGGLGRSGFDEWRRHYFKSIGAVETRASGPRREVKP